MAENQGIRDVQLKILEIMKYIDGVCRKNNITYFIMGGTALGAVRHGGFIPWDDDLDIFMTYDEYLKFKDVFYNSNHDGFIIQEWRTTPKYLEYAKVRMDGTTFIEQAFVDRKDLHQGIYVDIMILHKVPNRKFTQKIVYLYSKFVTLVGLSQRKWKPKTKSQSFALAFLKILPKRLMVNIAYKKIYKYDGLKSKFKWCYWITPVKFKSGIFDEEYFSSPVDIPFEDTKLLGSLYIKDYLKYRYGDYMKMPPEEQRKAAVHAFIYDTEKDYRNYINENSNF